MAGEKPRTPDELNERIWTDRAHEANGGRMSVDYWIEHYRASKDFSDGAKASTDRGENRTNRMTNPYEDIGRAYVFCYESPYGKEARAIARLYTQDYENVTNAAAYETDLRRAMYRYGDGCDAVSINDHMFPVIRRFVASDMESFRELACISQSGYDPILIAKWPERFEWLYDLIVGRMCPGKKRGEERDAAKRRLYQVDAG